MARQEQDVGQQAENQKDNEVMKNKYLTLFLASEIYSVEIAYATEIIGI